MSNPPAMRDPEPDAGYQVGDIVEVFCDHERRGARTTGWLRGIVVHINPESKMISVQFRTNVFLTEGWMVPDRLLSFPFSSPDVRPCRRTT